VLIVATAATLTVLARLLSGRTALGVAAGVGFALSPLAWRIATHADPHALHVLLVGLLLVALVAWEREHRDGGSDRWLLVAAAIFGLSLANHQLTLLLAPGIGLFVLAVDPRVFRRVRLVAACAAIALGTAALLYLELPLRAGPFRAPLVYARPDTLEGFVYVVLGQQFVGSIVDPFGDLAGKAVTLVDLVVEQFGVLAALVPLAFLVTAIARPRYALLTGAGALLTCFFAASYVNADISRYYLGPLLFAWSWLAVLAGAVVNGVRAVLAQRPIAAPASAAVALGLAAVVLAPTILDVPARSDAVDQSQDKDAREWVEDVVDALPRDAVVVSWWSYSTPLWYVQRVEHRRMDIQIVDDRTRLDENLGEIDDVIAANLGRRPVYIVRRVGDEMQPIRDRYRIEVVAGIAGTLYRVAGPATATP
jgi:hypothetical protein